MKGDNITYFDSFGGKYIPKEMKKFIKNENNTTNNFRIQSSRFNNVWIFLHWIF